MMQPFGVFAPSRPSQQAGAIDVAEGVFPLGPTEWRPFPRFNAYSNALASAPIGAVQVATPAGVQHVYAATTTKLYRLNTATTPWSWTDVTGSLSFSLSGESIVDFVGFGDKVLAFNQAFGGIVQADIGSGNFALISGSPSSSFGGVFGDRVWAMNQSATPNRVEFSAPNNHTIWGDYSRGADFQVFEAGGPVTGAVVVGNAFYVFQENAIQAFVRDAGPLLFQRQTVRENFGSPARGSIVPGSVGAYFMSEDGFYQAGGDISPIGSGVVDEWFFDTQADLAELWRIQGAHDPSNKFILWRYATPGFAGSGYTNKVLGFSYETGRWFGFNLECAWLLRAASPGILLDAITNLVDDTTITIDSRTWAGGRPQLGGFDSDFKFGFFDGSPMAVTIETADLQLSPGNRSRINGFRVAVEGSSSYTGQIGRKASPTAATSWTSANTTNSAGIVTTRGEGLYLKARVNIPAGEGWTALSGVELIGTSTAGRR
jgi:hypothetical protein